MNKVFRIIWNGALNRFDVVSEFAKNRKKCRASVSLAKFINCKQSVLALAIASAFGSAFSYADIVVSGDVNPNIPTTPTWAIPGALTVGDTAQGALSITNGSVASNGNVESFVGKQAGSSGTVTVTGPGSEWLASTGSYIVNIGYYGSGTLTVEDGASFGAGQLWLGRFADSTGLASFRGNETRAVLNAQMYVGLLGNGSLELLDGAQLTGYRAQIGTEAGSIGNAILSGANTRWDISDYFAVGNKGTGNLRIEDGAVVSVANNSTVLGNEAIGSGTVTVSGTGSQLNTRPLTIGNAGVGGMLIENGGLASAQSVTVGSAAGSSGVVEVTGVGSRLTSESSIMIGVFGSGTMKIADGGVVTSDPGLAIVGFLDGSTGLLELTGTGSRLDTTSPLFIAYGSGSQGNLNILDGATMTSGEAQVGQEGTGNVHISGGGSTWQVADLFWVGSNGDGSVVVDGGGTLKSDIALVGHMAGSNGQILISGQGSSWNTPSIYLSGDYFGGNGGDSSLTINNGAIVKANNISMATGAVGSAVLNIGNAAGSAATAAGIIEGQSVTMAGDSTVVFNHTDSNYQFNPSIEGVGKVDIYSGTTLLNGSNSYAGTTTVAGGALQAGAAGAFSAASNYIVGRAGLLDLAGFSQTLNSLNNSGTVSFNGAPGTVLTINGDYTGNDGLLNFNSVLGADTSVTDKLVINGNTSGTTRVGVTNLGGSGAETLNGIELIAVNGLSDGEFVKQGRIVAGAYDYSLARGTGTNSGNWYLTSAVIPVDPIPPVDPVPPVDPAPPIEPINPAPMVERPEAGSYTANLAAANNLFVTSLNDRQGETQYIDALTGEHKVTSLWMRNEGGHNRSRDASGQLQTQSNRYVLQLGGDIAQWSYNNMDRFRLGMMAGYGNNKSNTHSSHSGYRSEGSVDGYTVGLYGTWYANDEDKSGLYVDSWAQYNWFNNSVQGEGLSREEYKSKGVTASVESGYTFNLGENADKTKTYFIQPKAQVTWMGVKADDHREANGTQVSGLGDGNIQTRLGARVYMKGQNSKGQEFQPFVETNWVHNTEDFGTMMNDTEVKQAGAKNIGELKLGIEGQISKRLNIWGNVGQQVGNKGYSDTDVMLGMQYNF